MAGDEHEVVKVFRAMLEKTEEFAQQGQELTRRINDFDDDLKEHNAAIDIMRGVKADRKCFRMIGGVLVERTTGEVLPALDHNREQLVKMLGHLKSQRDKLQKEKVAHEAKQEEYQKKHGITIQQRQ